MTAPRWYRSPWPQRAAVLAIAALAIYALKTEINTRRVARGRLEALERSDSLKRSLQDVQFLLTVAKLEAGDLRKEKDGWLAREAESDRRYAGVARRLDALTQQLASMPLQSASDTLAAFPVLVEKCNECERAKTVLAEAKVAADSARLKAEGETRAVTRSDSIRADRNAALEVNNADLAKKLAESDPPCRSKIPFTKCLTRKQSLFIGILLTEVVRGLIRSASLH
jgi:hypothetical protein